MSTTVPPRTGGVEPLLDAALDVVAELGVDALTVRATAARAGVSPGTVSYHFATSDDLLVRALEHGADQTAVMLEQLAADLVDGDWDVDAWPGVFAAALAHGLEVHLPQNLACLELHMLAARRPEIRPAAQRVQLAYARVAALAVRVHEAPDPVASTVLLVALVTGLMYREITMPEPGAEERLRNDLEGITDLLRAAKLSGR